MKTKPKVVAIVQARMSATRLPGKVMAKILDQPMLWHVVRALGFARHVDQVVVGTSVSPADDAIAEFCASNSIECYRGSETDVLDRYYQAAKQYGAGVVVRITADCPLVDPKIVDQMIEIYLQAKEPFDYVTNTIRYTYPDGLDAEVFSYAALERTWGEAKSPTEREHVTTYMRASGCFRVFNVENQINLPSRNMRWTVDEPRDLEFVRSIYARLQSHRQPFGQEDVLRLLATEPQLMEINKGITRNEGYYKSFSKESPKPPLKRELKRSYELKARALELIPSCTQTFSKGPSQFVQGVAPVFLSRGQGSHVWDVDGNEYIDYAMALGPVILGHNYPAVTEAVIRQIRDGISFTLPHPLELEVAELLVRIVPCAEMVRFGKNGSDATGGAVRAARAFTGKQVIACCGYHGWQDWYVGTTTRDRGVPEATKALTVSFNYNDMKSLERVLVENKGNVAAVIMEPIGVEEPRDGFLQNVRDLTKREGVVLIFDEVVTGFRLALGGAQEYFGVKPDLACVGKAIANGYPLSAVVGRRDIMRIFDEIFFSFTFGGDTASLAAAVATITEMREKNVIAYLWQQGEKIQEGYNVLAKELGVDGFTKCIGLPPRTVATFRDKDGTESLELKSLFQQECLKRGVLFSGGHNICYSHTDRDIEETLRTYRAAMEILADSIKAGDTKQRLEGPPVQPVFRRT